MEPSSPKSDDLNLPKTTVNACIKNALPPNMKVTPETQDLVCQNDIKMIAIYFLGHEMCDRIYPFISKRSE